MINRRRRVSDAERALWQAAMRDAQRLDGKPAPLPTETAPGPAPVAKLAAVHRAPIDRTPTLDRRTAEKLRRGRLPIEARLDLHGMTQATAERTLTDFVERMAGDGRRNLLVITGKGIRPGAARGEAQIGILRREVPRWLKEAPLRGYILAVQEATPEHGGSGALYVLLRRARPVSGDVL